MPATTSNAENLRGYSRYSFFALVLTFFTTLVLIPGNDSIADFSVCSLRSVIMLGGNGYNVFSASTDHKFAALKKQRAQGKASWYGNPYHGRKMASGKTYNMYSMSAAHAKLPFNTQVKVTNVNNGESVMVKIEDRGPFVKNRILDVSFKAADELKMLKAGVAEIVLETLAPEQMEARPL